MHIPTWRRYRDRQTNLDLFLKFLVVLKIQAAEQASKGNYGYYYSTIAPKKYTLASKQDKIYSYVANIWSLMKKMCSVRSQARMLREAAERRNVVSEKSLGRNHGRCVGSFFKVAIPLSGLRFPQNKSKAFVNPDAVSSDLCSPSQRWHHCSCCTEEGSFEPQWKVSGLQLQKINSLSQPESLVRSPFNYIICTSAKLLSSWLCFQSSREAESLPHCRPLRIPQAYGTKEKPEFLHKTTCFSWTARRAELVPLSWATSW